MGVAGVEKLQGRPASVGEFSHRGQFELVKELYVCGTGSVHLARVIKDQRTQLRDQVVVLKRRQVPELGRAKDMLNEYEVLKGLRHPNIIRCHGYFWEFGSQSLYIVLEYANRGDLHTELQTRKRLGRQFGDDEVWDILAQCLLGLVHIHSKGIVHRDIKSLNLFLTDTGVVKLGDFGVSRQMSDKTMFLNSFYGTPLYLSPELIEGQPYARTTDIWSLGVVLYELLTLQPPFKGPGLQDVIAAVLRCQYPQLPRSRPAQFGQVLSSMLTREASRRPSAEELLRMIERFGKLRRVGSDNHQQHQQQQPAGAAQQSPPSSGKSSASKNSAVQPAGAFACTAEPQEDAGAEVVRVSRRRPSSAGSQARAPELHPDAALGQPVANQGKSLWGLPAGHGSPGHGYPASPPVPAGDDAAAAAKPPRSMRDARWEARRNAHVLRVTRANRADLKQAWGAADTSECEDGGSQDDGAVGSGSVPRSGSASTAAAVAAPPMPFSEQHLLGAGRPQGSRPPMPPGATQPLQRGAIGACRPAAGRAWSEEPRSQSQSASGSRGRQQPAVGRRYDIIANRWIDC
eukprot:TRINITY_DN29348_c0_g1_i1.p1 TRINITY_DN29348_c0_g1~~TRINITY_DN29348_c0_g1_i1.p1  ORF type:complete len:598 (-),score=83.21 TRINITY_DN29348_c0_g1_i1:99-1814(-)